MEIKNPKLTYEIKGETNPRLRIFTNSKSSSYEKIEKKLQKNLVDWKSRCNFAKCLTLNNKKRRNERRKDICKTRRDKEACKPIQGERSYGIYGTQIRQR